MDGFQTPIFLILGTLESCFNLHWWPQPAEPEHAHQEALHQQQSHHSRSSSTEQPNIAFYQEGYSIHHHCWLAKYFLCIIPVQSVRRTLVVFCILSAVANFCIMESNYSFFLSPLLHPRPYFRLSTPDSYLYLHMKYVAPF